MMSAAFYGPFLQGIGLGTLFGYILHKHLSGTASVEEEAWWHGYYEGLEDSKRIWRNG